MVVFLPRHSLVSTVAKKEGGGGEEKDKHLSIMQLFSSSTTTMAPLYHSLPYSLIRTARYSQGIEAITNQHTTVLCVILHANPMKHGQGSPRERKKKEHAETPTYREVFAGIL